MSTGVASDEFPAAFVNRRTSTAGAVPKPDQAELFAQPAGNGAAPAPTRSVLFAGVEHETPIYQRSELGRDATFDGPTIIDDLNATILVPSGERTTLDDLGNVVISIRSRG